MSPHVANFVHDLVAMAKAMEENPVLQEQIEALKVQLSQAQDHNAGLEVNIISYKQQIDDLQAKVRSLEVERDDASFRTMEVEDKLNTTLVDLSSILKIGERIHTRLVPPKPEPVKESEPVLPQAVPSEPELEHEQAATSFLSPASPADATQGQSESPPIASLPQSEQPKEEQTASVTQLDTASAGSSPVEAEPIDPEPTPKYSYEWYQWNDRRNERAAIAASGH